MLTRTSTALLDGLKNLSDPSAWQAFDVRYRPLLMAVGRKLGLSIADAEDGAQETLVAFITEYHAGRYQREKGRLRDWLSGIMANKVRDIRRYQKKQSERMASEQEMDDLSADDAAVGRAIEEEWEAAILRDCLDRVRQEVAPSTFESFERFALHQEPADAVARRLGLSVDAIYQNKRRVLARIRELMPQVKDSW